MTERLVPLTMKPSEYIEKSLESRSNSFSQQLSPLQLADAGEVISAGTRMIGKVLDRRFSEINPEVIESLVRLECFLIVFIEHAMNPDLLKESLRA